MAHVHWRWSVVIGQSGSQFARFKERKAGSFLHNGDGFFLSREFWETVRPFIPRLRIFCFVLFLKWRSAHSHQFHSLFQHQSTVAQPAETTVAECSLTNCVWARFRIGSHTMPWQRQSQPDPTSLGQVKGVCVFRCNLPPALLAKWPGSFMCYCGNKGVEQTPNKTQHTHTHTDKHTLLSLPHWSRPMLQ